MSKRKRSSPEKHAIQPGMEVSATEGDLGGDDISAPKVENVVRDQQGRVESVVVAKGLIFKKELTVPAERIVSVEAESASDSSDSGVGTLTIATNDEELDALAPTGAEDLVSESANSRLIGQVEEDVPTTEGMRRKEARSVRHKRRPAEAPPSTPAPAEASAAATGNTPALSLKTLGPGFLSGMAGNDASAVTSYSVNGATNGYGQLWLLLLSTPLLQAVQYTCARIGRVTQQGLAELLRTHYGYKVAVPASLLLIVANIALITADLVAIGTGLQLVTGLPWGWFVVPVAATLWYLTVYR
ncbi:MAG: divalent metal cation transporter, partial [Ktedonobacterales bacterium]